MARAISSLKELAKLEKEIKNTKKGQKKFMTKDV